MSLINNYIGYNKCNLPDGFKFVEYPSPGMRFYQLADNQGGIRSSICFRLKGPNGKVKEFEMTLLPEWSSNSEKIRLEQFKYVLSEAFKDPFFMEPYLGFKLI